MFPPPFVPARQPYQQPYDPSSTQDNAPLPFCIDSSRPPATVPGFNTPVAPPQSNTDYGSLFAELGAHAVPPQPSSNYSSLYPPPLHSHTPAPARSSSSTSIPRTPSANSVPSTNSAQFFQPPSPNPSTVDLTTEPYEVEVRRELERRISQPQRRSTPPALPRLEPRDLPRAHNRTSHLRSSIADCDGRSE